MGHAPRSCCTTTRDATTTLPAAMRLPGSHPAPLAPRAAWQKVASGRPPVPQKNLRPSLARPPSPTTQKSRRVAAPRPSVTGAG